MQYFRAIRGYTSCLSSFIWRDTNQTSPYCNNCRKCGIRWITVANQYPYSFSFQIPDDIGGGRGEDDDGGRVLRAEVYGKEVGYDRLSSVGQIDD